MIDDTLLLQYLDGELDAATTAMVEARLRHEPALRRRIAELRAIEVAYGAPGPEQLATERRVALLERLRTLPGVPRYDLLRRADLEALTAIHSDRWPIVSLYLDMRPERRVAEPPLARFKALTRQAEQRLDLAARPKAYHEAWEAEVERLHAWLEAEQPVRGRGLAVVSCHELGLWRAFRLPVPVTDRLEVNERPYLRPLLTLIDEFERYLVVLADAGSARLVEVFLGEAEDVTELVGYVPPATGQFVEKTGHRHDTFLHRHAKTVLEYAEAYWRGHNCDWLVIGGTEEALGELRRQAPKALRDRLAGELALSPQVELDYILDRVLEIERAHEQRIETERVTELITTAHGGGPAVLGLEPTLRAVVDGRVRLLIAAEEFAQAGWECPNCTFLGVQEQNTCPLCGTALAIQPDVVERAMERTLDQGGAIEVLRSVGARESLTQYGQIGALLRYTYPMPEAGPAEAADQAAGTGSATLEQRSEPAPAQDSDQAVSRADIEATLQQLLAHFGSNLDQGPEQIARFARAGADALLAQQQSDIWLDSSAGASLLGISVDELHEQIRRGALPAARGADGTPRLHRRDLSLYRLSQQLGATEPQTIALTPPVAWSADLATWGLDPWRELTPG
jgi:hypothetical protein